MNNNSSRPVLTVFAGPNGSGKSTITSCCKIKGHYVNADEIKRHLKCSDLEAAKIAESTREHLLDKKESFTFETVLSTERNYNLMRRAKQAGYTVVCIFILTANPDINVRRVAYRVKHKGHGVPEEKIRQRYDRAMKLFPMLFEVCDELYVYDNSQDNSIGSPSMIIKYQYNDLEKMPNNVWSSEMLCNLCSGNYRA